MLTGEMLRLIRIMKGMKQETIARALRISQPAYCKLEKSDSINGEKLEQLLKVLNCTKEEIEDFKKTLPPQSEN